MLFYLKVNCFKYTCAVSAFKKQSHQAGSIQTIVMATKAGKLQSKTNSRLCHRGLLDCVQAGSRVDSQLGHNSFLKFNNS